MVTLIQPTGRPGKVKVVKGFKRSVYPTTKTAQPPAQARDRTRGRKQGP
jgi:hypothetical protein